VTTRTSAGNNRFISLASSARSPRAPEVVSDLDAVGGRQLGDLAGEVLILGANLRVTEQHHPAPAQPALTPVK
jgi:hypothetical protein